MKNHENLLDEAGQHLEEAGEMLEKGFTSNKDALKIVGALLIGAALGAIAALLFSPGRGADTRRSVGNSVKNLGNNIGDKAKQGASRVSELSHEMVEKLRPRWKTSEPNLN